MITLNFEEQHLTIPVSYKLLRLLANEVDGDYPQYGNMFQALFALNIPSIDEALARNLPHDDAGDTVSVETIDELWARGSLKVRRSLAGHSGFLERLSDRQASDIMAMDDSKICKSVAVWAECLCREPLRRLGRGMAEKLLRHLVGNASPSVREALAKNDELPQEYRLPLGECLRLGCLPVDCIEKLGRADLKLVRKADPDVLQRLASSIEDVADRSVRMTLARFLAGHPDPAVRLALAENRWAPAEVLSLLFDDADPDVAILARQNAEEEVKD